MKDRLHYLLRLLTPPRLYAYSTKVRVPKSPIEYRKLLTARYLLNQGGSVIDGGAHIGYFTRLFSEIVEKEGKVWSFEPNPYAFSLLCKQTRYSNNVKALPYALSDKTEKRVPFYITPFSLAQNSTVVTTLKTVKQKRIFVKMIELDSLAAEIQDLKLIKLDIEGNELNALKGATQLLKKWNPWIVFEYVNADCRSDRSVVSFLEQNQYSCFDLKDLNPLDSQVESSVTDVLAIPKQNPYQGVVDALKVVSSSFT